MTLVPGSLITERLGVFYTGYVCSRAGVVFRETASSDIGVDGQIELVDADGCATGILAGVQIKSGDSFANADTAMFTFRAEQKHFEYWARYSLPVIGVVFSPTLEMAVWFDLSKYSEMVADQGGPFQITARLSPSNEFNAESMASSVTNLIKQYHGRPVSSAQVPKMVPLEEQERQHSDDVLLSREIAWKRLTTIFLFSRSSPYVLASVGNRLSWYFPAVSQSQQIFFKERIARVSDQELTNIISAIHVTLVDDREDVARLLCDLVDYLPSKVNRLKALGRSGIVPSIYLEALFQTIEYFTQSWDEDYRSEVLSAYGLG